MPALVTVQDSPVGQDDLRREEAVRGHAVRATKDPKASAEREPGDTDCRAGASRNAEVVLAERFVELTSSAPAPTAAVPAETSTACVESHVDEDPDS